MYLDNKKINLRPVIISKKKPTDQGREEIVKKNTTYSVIFLLKGRLRYQSGNIFFIKEKIEISVCNIFSKNAGHEDCKF